MGVDFKLLSHNKNKEKFDLGRGNWCQLFPSKKPFLITDIAETSTDLSILVELSFKDKDYSEEDCKNIAEKIWNWSQGKTIYFGNDCNDIYDENNQELFLHDYIETGTRYG